MMKAPNRKTDYPIHPLISGRWSARAMKDEPIEQQELNSLFEAARWAPSSYNNQPWRYLYAQKQTDYWARFFDLLVPFNQTWCANAAALGLAIARKNFSHNEKPSRTHAFDAGASWMLLCLEAASRNIVVHGIEGFDYEKARQTLYIPESYEILAMFAIGKLADKQSLPKDLQEKEKPNTRHLVQEFAFQGPFPQNLK